MKIAVVLSACEYPHLLGEALGSVLHQTRAPDEVIVVVDGKDIDVYSHMLQSYSVSTIILPENMGVSTARNRGIDAAIERDMDAVYLLDEDDKLTPYAVERMEHAAELVPEAGIFYPDRATFGLYVSYDQAPEFDPALLKKGPYIISSVLMRQEAFLAVKRVNGQGFCEHLHTLGLRWEDYLFFLEAYHCRVRFCHVGGMAMTMVRVHNNLGSNIANATTEQWWEYARERLETLYGETQT